jgi:prepilin-type N-terminal cleavage/methylation domain-containing protein
MRTKAGPGERGFTMVEVLVTLSMAVFGMMGALGMHLATLRANEQAAISSEAVNFAHQTIEEVRGLSVTQLVARYDTDGQLPLDHDFDGTTLAGRVTTFQRRLVVEPNPESPDLLRIRVEVWWGDDGAALDDVANRRTIALEVLRTRQEVL